MSATNDRSRLPAPALSSLFLNAASDRAVRPFPQPRDRATRRLLAVVLGVTSTVVALGAIATAPPAVWRIVAPDSWPLLAVLGAFALGWAWSALSLKDWYALYATNARFSDDVASERDRCAVGRWPVTGFFLAVLAVYVFGGRASWLYEEFGLVALLFVPSLQVALLAWRFPDPNDLRVPGESSPPPGSAPLDQRALVIAGFVAWCGLIAGELVPNLLGLPIAAIAVPCFVVVVAWAIWLVTRRTQDAIYPIGWSSTLPLLALYASVSGPLCRHLPIVVTFAALAVSLIISLLFDIKRAWCVGDTQPLGSVFRG